MGNFFTIDDVTLREGIRKCLAKAGQLVDDAIILLNHGGMVSHVFGLYTFAIEEYGKALLLKDHLDDSTSGKRIPMEIFGRRGGKKSHEKKIARALKEVHDNCKNFRIGVVVRAGSDTTKTMTYKGKSTVVVAPMQTGSFFDASSEYIVDFVARMEAFYIDWDEGRKQWKAELTVDKDQLENATIELRKHLRTFKMN